MSVFSTGKRAEAGIGTLILFIAMILVAAVAAAVLIQSAGSLQSKALSTGSRAQSQVSTQAIALSLVGKDASVVDVNGDRSINMSFLKIKLAAGSEPIKLDDALLQVDVGGQHVNLRYDPAVDCLDETAGPGGLFNETHYTLHYGVRTLIGNPDGYIERSDVVELCFAFPSAVTEGSDIVVRFTPKIGSPTLIQTKTPDIMLTQQVQLYP